MNSTIASNINGGAVMNHQVANGSRSSLLLSCIEFSLTEIKTNFVPPSNQGRYLIQLTGKEELLNGQNKSLTENSIITINGNKEKTSEDSVPVPKLQLYAGKVNVEWRQVYKIGAGLNNLGNTCFMNTVIQCLTYCPPLANYLLHDNDHSSKCTITGFCMMCILQRHMKRAIGKTGEVIKPIDIYQRLKLIAKHFQFGRQEDAHEFLRYVIDHLWKACLPQANGLSKLDPSSKETTVINKIFGGYHRSQVICLKCKKESNTFDHFMDFILDIKQNVMSLEKALDKFTQPELLQHDNSYQCPKCKMKVEAKKQFSVYRAPTVATFQLKRFDYNRTFGGKITKQISYPEKLNLRPYMSETKGEPVWYRLNAVLVHSGPSCNSGHYYCYVKNSNGFWYIMDDQRVSQVSLNQVLNESAYVLFYIKMEDRERAPLQKYVDVKSTFLKGEVSNKHFEKSPEIKNSLNNPKATPLRLTNCNQSIAPRKSDSTPNREKVSFGFRAGLSPNAFTPKSLGNKSTSTPPGLVPYNEDSSDSSDTGQTVKKTGEQLEQQNLKNNCLEIKAKLSKSVSSSLLHSLPRAVPKVSGNWIVTDASETASCSSSTSGTNSLSDWKITAIEDIPKAPSISKQFKTQVSETSNHSPVKETDMSSTLTLKDSFGNFHKHQSTLLGMKDSGQNFHKRKSCDSYSRTSKELDQHSEKEHTPSHKKTKHAEKSPFLTIENGDKNSSRHQNVLDSGTLKQKLSSASNSDSHFRTLDMNGVLSPDKKSGFSGYKDAFRSYHSPENRVHANLYRESSFTKGKHKDKNDQFEDSKSDRRRSPISNHVKNNFLYGTEIPTWKNENYHRSSVPDYARRRSFDDYDEDYDRGKVRKMKRKDQSHYFHRNNPFQKHSDRHYKQWNGKFYNSQYHHRKPYDFHCNWKSKHSSNHHRHRNHHQRSY